MNCPDCPQSPRIQRRMCATCKGSGEIESDEEILNRLLQEVDADSPTYHFKRVLSENELRVWYQHLKGVHGIA